DKLCWVFLIRFAPSVGNIQCIARCGQFKPAVPWNVEGVCHSAEHIFAPILRFPCSLIALHSEVSAQKHYDHFIVPCTMFPVLSLSHFPGSKTQIVPVCGLWGYAVVCSLCFKGLDQ